MKAAWVFVALFTSSLSHAEVSQSRFLDLLERLQTEFQPLAKSAGEELTIGAAWDDDSVNAVGRRWPPDFFVTVNGGVARAPEMDEDALALAVCHELGHGYGGEPYTDTYNRIAAEGQADYFGGSPECIGKYFTDFPSMAAESSEDDPYIRSACNALELPVCGRVLRAALRLTGILAQGHGEPAPRLGHPDPTVVPETLLGHPKSMQCRLDTFDAAILGKARPRCWFAR